MVIHSTICRKGEDDEEVEGVSIFTTRPYVYEYLGICSSLSNQVDYG